MTNMMQQPVARFSAPNSILLDLFYRSTNTLSITIHESCSQIHWCHQKNTFYQSDARKKRDDAWIMAFRCDGVKYVKYIRARDAYSYNDSRPLIPTKRDECTYAAKPNTKESIQYRSCVTPHKEAISITLELVAPLTRRRTDYYIDFAPYEEAD